MKNSSYSNIDIEKIENGYLVTICFPAAFDAIPPFIKNMLDRFNKNASEPEPGEEWKKGLKNQDDVILNVNGILGEKKPIAPYREFIAKTWDEVLEIINANKI